MSTMKCNDCGETWQENGDLTCPFCGSEDISQEEEEEE